MVTELSVKPSLNRQDTENKPSEDVCAEWRNFKTREQKKMEKIIKNYLEKTILSPEARPASRILRQAEEISRSF